MSKHLDTIVEEKGNSQAAENMTRNLLEVHCNIWHLVKDKLTNVLVPLINIIESTTYHYRSALFLAPRYVMDLKDINTFHQSENGDTKKLSRR